jgi:hypothetical protein
MTTREKIIVGIMCLAIIYGAWELIGYRKKDAATTPENENLVAQARSFISDLSKKVVSEKVPDGYNYIVNQVGENWSRDPFLMQSGALSTQKETEKPAEPEKTIEPVPVFIYSGYLQVGDSKLAVINGLEYAVGESLNIDNYYVKSISPLKVFLAQTNGSKTLELPMQESLPE